MVAKRLTFCFFILFWNSANANSPFISEFDPVYTQELRRAKKICLWMAGTLSKNYRAFLNRQVKKKALLYRPEVEKLLKLKKKHCSRPSLTEGISRIFHAVVNHHSGKVGVILPLSGDNHLAGKALLSGIHAALNEEKKSLKNRLIVKDTQSISSLAETALAELVLIENVGFIITGGPPDHFSKLKPWADLLHIPVLFMTSSKNRIDRSRFAFRVFPSQLNMARVLVITANNKKYKKISILRPDNGKSDTLIRLVEQEALKNKIEIIDKISYASGDYLSMDLSSKKLFQINPQERKEEYEDLVKQAKEKAEKSGTQFNPRKVILDPIISSDAIFIPDNYRIVRHFVKIFKYHGVRKIPLIGNQQWRSQGLLEPNEPFLRGSFFVDFIGSYANLPGTFNRPSEKSPYFEEPNETLQTDLRMIGYRTMELAAQVFSDLTVRKRIIPQILKRLKPLPSYFFGSAMAFKSDHSSHWPAFVFTIGRNDLQITPYWPYSQRRTLSAKDPPPEKDSLLE